MPYGGPPLTLSLWSRSGARGSTKGPLFRALAGQELVGLVFLLEVVLHRLPGVLTNGSAEADAVHGGWVPTSHTSPTRRTQDSSVRGILTDRGALFVSLSPRRADG